MKASHGTAQPGRVGHPPEIRKVICTLNAIESVNMGLRNLTKNRGSFSSDKAGLECRADTLYHSALRAHLHQLKSELFAQNPDTPVLNGFVL